MNDTALRANQKMLFISEAHEKFYYEMLNKMRYQDVYARNAEKVVAALIEGIYLRYKGLNYDTFVWKMYCFFLFQKSRIYLVNQRSIT